ncbi:FMN-binding protein [Frankia sp. CcI49]|uniref:FMN-binding protein n=1 Tax=unclassified Frankia TaxID=2632575 RepID=UPI0006C9FDFE|nr:MULTISPECIES: FMN-binding protein [unclassified Frankia]KPM54862.1 FMN-binding protein [Frankia sp. R43]ONH61056.1 FMN-binding protein [Frankia sp. CcI49]
MTRSGSDHGRAQGPGHWLGGRLGLAALFGAVVLVVGAKAVTGAPPAPSAAIATMPGSTAAAGSTGSTGSAAAGSTGSAGADGGGGSGSSSAGESGSSAESGTGAGDTSVTTVTGDSVSTRFGPVQVRVDLRNGQITDVVALALPDQNGRDRRINAEAVPILRQAVLDAQSAAVDTVSGATYTSVGYLRSVQSALDQAGIGD